MTFDESVLSFFEQNRFPRLTQVMSDLTALGSFSVLLIFSLVTLVLLANYRDRIGAYQMLTVLAGTIVIPRALKMLIARPRPGVADHLTYVTDSSFPSGHSFSAAAVYLTLAFFASRYRARLRYEKLIVAMAVVVTLLVGISRMYLGVHYPTDVIGGVVLGVAWAALVAFLFHRARGNGQQSI